MIIVRETREQRDLKMINFVTAQNAGLKFALEGQSLTQGMFAATAQEAADLLLKHGVESLMGSSTMDFADEEGFETHDGAQNMLNEAIAIAVKTAKMEA